MKTLIPISTLLPVIKAEKRNNGSEFTLTSVVSRKEFTYKISRSEFKGKWYTHITVENQYRKFVRVGSYFNGKIFNKGVIVETPSAKAIGYVLGKIELGAKGLEAVVELRHGGNCLRCGRELSDSKSLDRGLGPTCASF